MNSSNKTVLSNFIWRLAERSGAQIVTFVVSIVLARVLDPNVYGTVALVTAIMVILQVFVDSGLGNALIQKKDADDVDFSTVFYTNIIFCIVLYVTIYLVAPLLARFYSDDSMTSLIRVLGITVLFSGVKNVQQAFVSRNMLFKKFFFSTLAGTIAAAIIGIVMAYAGFGVWALVAQYIINTAVDTIVLWITVKWRPKKAYSLQRLKELFSYGWKLLISALIDTLYNNIRTFIIGKIYTSSDLAFYNRGQQFPNVIVSNINASIDSVLLPTMSMEQDNRERVKAMTRRAIKTSTYVMAPLMMGLSFAASPIISLVLTDKWLPCVPYLRIFCITYMFYPIHTANLNAIKAMGRSDLFLKLEILKKIVGFTILLLTMNHGVMTMAYSLLVISLFSQIINSWPNKKLLNYSYLEQLKDIIPSILLSIIMGIAISFIAILDLPNIIIVILQISLGAIIYILESEIFKLESYLFIKETIRPILKKLRIVK